MRKATLGLILVLAGAGALLAESYRIRGSGQASFDCGRNPSVEVDGSGMVVYLTGDCQKIEVDGTNNRVIAEGVGKVELSGINHQVTYLYALGGRARPAVEQNGFGHRVERREGEPAAAAASPTSSQAPSTPPPSAPRSSTPPPTPAGSGAAGSGSSTSLHAVSGLAVASAFLPGGSGALHVNGDRVRRTVACGGRMVQVNGSGSAVKLTGDCPTVQVNGDSNEVWIERIDDLLIHGENNAVRYVGGVQLRLPRATVTGAENYVRPASIEEFDAR